MKRLEAIRVLLDDMEKQLKYNQDFAKESAAVVQHLKSEGQNYWHWRSYMPPGYEAEPVQSVVKRNAMTIRRLLLNYYRK